MFRTGTQNYLHIDTSELQETIHRLRIILTEREMRTLMYRVFSRTASGVRTLVSREVREDYEAPSRWIRNNIGAPRISMGHEVNCSIPIDGVRGGMGRQFHASRPGGRPVRGRRYKINARVVKGQKTQLPEVMRNIGGQPPFIAEGKKLSGIVFTRKGKDRLPIVKVVGIGVPQMPMNRAQDDIQDEILNLMGRRIEHEYKYLIGRIK